MKRVFIVTPFGVKNGIDFARVVSELIQPAIAKIGFNGGTTGEIIKQGNIRTDMFQELLVADLVIADISIHNANAFYELGARHAFREKHTFLIRCSKESLPAGAQLDDVPFDLKTDRYMEYHLDDLAGSCEQLILRLKVTLASQDRDSPIFQLLPRLEEHDHEVFIPVPLDFREAVQHAAAAAHAGDLAMLAEEAEGFPWELPALRLIGKTLFDMKRFDLARQIWEHVRDRFPLDLEANLALGTIYERGDDLVRSNQALDRALSSPRIQTKDSAEAHALRGRNMKRLWLSDWESAGNRDEQRLAALRSKFLEESYEQYLKGFEEDQNEFYPGLNALSMLVIRIELATALKEAWEGLFEDETVAGTELVKLQKKRQQLAGAVSCSLEATQKRVNRAGVPNPWLEASLADLRFLTSIKPNLVAEAYRRAITSLGGFYLDSIKRQLLLFEKLGLLTENVGAALALPKWGQSSSPAPAGSSAPSRHVILFTGHRIDEKHRKVPRFPADKEAVARDKIKEAVSNRLADLKEGQVIGLSGAASGGDILFLEVCRELGIDTELYLALPKQNYRSRSVADSGPKWESRFDALVAAHPKYRVLSDEEELPLWLQPKKGYDLWRRNNRWMLHNAIALGGEDITFLALWNGEGGDGPGGTEEMVKQVKELQARTIIIDTKKEFGP